MMCVDRFSIVHIMDIVVPSATAAIVINVIVKTRRVIEVSAFDDPSQEVFQTLASILEYGISTARSNVESIQVHYTNILVNTSAHHSSDSHSCNMHSLSRKNDNNNWFSLYCYSPRYISCQHIFSNCFVPIRPMKYAPKQYSRKLHLICAHVV